MGKLLDNPSAKTTLEIGGKDKQIKAMARFRTVNYLDDEYIKIIFDDHSFMLVLINDQELYYSDKYSIDIPEVTDEMIGEVKTIKYKGKVYELGNKDDYQFCQQKYVGGLLDIEGECRFSDYFPTEGPKEFLSLGWLAYNGKRADINPQIIDLKEVKVV